MRSDRLKHTSTFECLAADVFFSQIAGEPNLTEWGIQEYIDVCLNYLKVTYLPESWILELVSEVKKLQRAEI